MQSINLMPPGYARNERAKRRLIISATIMAAALMAMLGLGRLTQKWIRGKEQANAVLEGELNELKRSRAELGRHTQRLQGLAERFSVIQTLRQNRRWASYLAHIAAAANDEILLTRAKITPARPEPDDSGRTGKNKMTTPATTPNDAQDEEMQDKVAPEKLVLLLEGYALSNTDITRFIAALSAPGIFETVTFKGSQMAQINARQVSRFELECPIRYEPRKRGTKAAAPGVANATTRPEEPSLISETPAPDAGGRP